VRVYLFGRAIEQHGLPENLEKMLANFIAAPSLTSPFSFCGGVGDIAWRCCNLWSLAIKVELARFLRNVRWMIVKTDSWRRARL
jgi:hypothetical protein